MKTYSIAPFVMLREIGRLLELFPRPKWWGTNDEQVARQWSEVFAGVSEEQLVAAVTKYRQGDHGFMPKAGQLRALAQKESRSGAVEADSWAAWLSRGMTDVRGLLSPCPVCGRAHQAQPRVTIVHNHIKHRAAGVPCIGCCDEVGCLGTYQVKLAAAPQAVSPGELWVPDGEWQCDFKTMHQRREELRARPEGR